MSKTLVFAMQPEHTLEFVDDDGQHRSVRGSEPFTCGDAIAVELLTNPGIPIVEDIATLEGLTRAGLETLAAEKGVESPDDRSQYPTKAHLVDAVVAQSESADVEVPGGAGDQV